MNQFYQIYCNTYFASIFFSLLLNVGFGSAVGVQLLLNIGFWVHCGASTTGCEARAWRVVRSPGDRNAAAPGNFSPA